MIDNYIVKNCPSYFEGGCYGCDNLCQNISSCKIKQIVRKCLPQSHIPEVDELKEEILQILQVKGV